MVMETSTLYDVYHNGSSSRVLVWYTCGASATRTLCNGGY